MGKRFLKMKQLYDIQIPKGSPGQLNIAYADNPVGFSEWDSVRSLFDKMRVCAMKMQFIPHFDIPVPLNPVTSATNAIFSFAMVCHDPNSYESLATTSAYYQYENLKFKSMYHPWKYYARYQAKPSSNIDTWTDYAISLFYETDSICLPHLQLVLKASWTFVLEVLIIT
jgi:hypothetical protein